MPNTVGATIGRPKGAIISKQCVPHGKSLVFTVSNVLDSQWLPLQSCPVSAGIYTLVASICNLTFDPAKAKNIGYFKD